MNTITMLLASTGIVAIGFCIFFLASHAMEVWFDIQACKRDVERLERQIKTLQCNRLP